MRTVASGSVIEYHGVRGLVYRIKYRDASGRQVQETIGAAAKGYTRKHAESALRNKLTDVERDGYRRPQKVKFSEFAPDCVREHAERKMLKGSTSENYVGLVDGHLLPYFGRFELAKIEAQPEIIEKYISVKVREGLAAKTINNHLRLLNVILKQAVRRRIIRTNPLDSVDRPREHEPWMEILRENEISRLRSAYRRLEREATADKKAWWHLAYTLVFFCLLTALRASELVALRWEHVDLEGGLIEVREGFVRKWTSVPKGGRGRVIEAGPQTVALLRAHRRRSSFTRPQDFVFCHPVLGRRLEPGGLAKKYLRPALIAARILGEDGSRSRFRPYQDLRHTSLTYEAAAGNPISYIQYRAGHRNITTTMRYIHAAQVLFPGAAKKAELRILGSSSKRQRRR